MPLYGNWQDRSHLFYLKHFSFSTLKRVEKEWNLSRLQRGKDTTQTRRGHVEMHQDKNLTTSGPLLLNLVPMHWTCE